MTLDDLLVSTAGVSLRLVLLDARVRNDPLARSMQRDGADADGGAGGASGT